MDMARSSVSTPVLSAPAHRSIRSSVARLRGIETCMAATGWPARSLTIRATAMLPMVNSAVLSAKPCLRTRWISISSRLRSMRVVSEKDCSFVRSR